MKIEKIHHIVLIFSVLLAFTQSTFAQSCAGTATLNVTINPAPTATITPATPTVCPGASVTLTAPSGTGYTYQWKNAGVNIPSAQSATYAATNTGSYSVVVTNAAGCSSSASVSVSATTNCGVTVKIKVLLAGAYNTSSMRTNLQAANLLTTTNYPYTATPWSQPALGSLVSPMPTTATDFVLIEARSTSTYTMLETKPALLLSDGTVANINTGTAGVTFTTLTSGSSYYFVVRHRNHIDIMSANTITVPNATAYDFTTAANTTFGTNQQIAIAAGVYGMVPGDMSGNGLTTVQDYNIYANMPSGITVYDPRDINLDANITVADYNIYQPNASALGIPQIRY